MGARKELLLLIAILVCDLHITSAEVVNNNSESATTVEKDTERNCKAYATEGKVCSIPFVYKGVNYTKCTDVDSAPGRFWCSLTPDYDAEEKWAPCAGVNCDDCMVYTTEGQQCEFPFSYKGETYNYCTDVDSPNGLLWCSYNPVFDGQWGQCMDTLCGNCTVPTRQGKTCQFPFHYCGAEQHHCIMGEDGRPWCSLNGYTTYRGVDWDYCMPSQCSGKPELEISIPEMEADKNCKAFTTTGRECTIPFTYKGTLYPNATDVDNQGVKWCSLTSDFDAGQQWQNYAGSICKGCIVLTTVGATCRFPFEYKGRTFDYCTTVDEERLWCSTDPVFNGTWGFCRTDQTVCGVSFEICEAEIPEKDTTHEITEVEYKRVSDIYTIAYGKATNGVSVEECEQACAKFSGCRSFYYKEEDEGCEPYAAKGMHGYSEGHHVYWIAERPLRENDLRMVDAELGQDNNTITGRLEIYHDGKWGTICNRGWEKAAQKIACEQLDYYFDESIAYGSDGAAVIAVKPGKGDIVISGLDCVGFGRIGTFLHECPFSGWYNNSCIHDEDVMITCLNQHIQYSGEKITRY